MCKFIFSVVRASCSLTGTRERDAPITNFIFAKLGCSPTSNYPEIISLYNQISIFGIANFIL